MKHLVQDKRNIINGWYFTPDELASAISGERMLNASIDLSNICNLNCPYCFNEEESSVRKVHFENELTFDEILLVLHDLSSIGAKTINIVGAGEPTIDPNFTRAIEAIVDQGMKPVIFTNGIRIASDFSMIDFLHKKNACVVLKFDSVDEDIQDLVVGSVGYTRYRNQALENLKNAGFNSYEPTRLGLDTVVFKENLKDITKIHCFCRREGIFPIIADYIPTGRTANGQFTGFSAIRAMSESERFRVRETLQPPSPEERQQLYAELLQIDTQEFGINRQDKTAYYSGGSCSQLMGVYVDIRGDIWPCVARARKQRNKLSFNPLGNIRQGDNPSSIWKYNPYMRHIRETYTGACPYKSSFQLSSETSRTSELEIIQGTSE